MGSWLIEHGELMFALGGALLGLLGSSLSLWLRFNLQPLGFRLDQVTRDFAQLQREYEVLQTQLKHLEDFRNSLRLPDCEAHRERCESRLEAMETRQQIEMTGLKSAIELTFTRQISQVAEENRRFREELGRQLQNDARDLTRTQVTEDAVLNAVHVAIQSLRDKELANLFERLRDLERGQS